MSAWEVVFIIILAFSLIANFLSIPGNFIVVINALWYGLVTGFEKYSFTFLFTLVVIALAVEFCEFVLLSIGARRYGASRWGVVGGIVGGIVGSISGAFVTPILGAILGGFLGVMLGTLIVEMIFKKRNLRETSRAILGVLIGKVGSLTVKAIGTVTMVVLVSYKLFF